MTDTQIAEIAAKCSEAQRNYLFFPNGYADPNTDKALRRKGLVKNGTLSALGQSVAAYLKEQRNGA
jgi:hypothetical protein